MAGHEVSSFDKLPAQMRAKSVPENEYSLFKYKGKIFQRPGALFHSTYREWLPNSGYTQSVPYDLERYDQRFKGPDSSESIFGILTSITTKS